jgi:hypothetical protein
MPGLALLLWEYGFLDFLLAYVKTVKWRLQPIWNRTECQIQFRRILGPEEEAEWFQLESMLHGVAFSSSEDEIEWGLDKSKKFTSKLSL